MASFGRPYDSPHMINAEQTSTEHAKAWGNEAAYAGEPELAEQVKAAIESGDEDPAHLINYAAILLDLHRNRAALDWLLAHPAEYREYYQNLATAYAKTDSTKLEQIRENNGKSPEVPSCPNSIVAYMDWQGL